MTTLFSPGLGLAGGVLIGLSAVLLMAAIGRIAGASGIVGGLLTMRPDGEFAWRAIFVVGVLLGAGSVAMIPGLRPALAYEASTPVLIAGGLLVGFGTALGSGCTSGHGICGLPRLSLRSLVATLLFMASAIATVAVVRHLIGA